MHWLGQNSVVHWPDIIVQIFYWSSFKKPSSSSCSSFQNCYKMWTVSIWKFFKRYLKSGFFKKNVDDLEKCTCASLAIFEKRNRTRMRAFWNWTNRKFELLTSLKSRIDIITFFINFSVKNAKYKFLLNFTSRYSAM